MNGVLPTPENIKNHTYKLVRRFLLVSRRPPAAPCKEFVDFVLSPQGQKILENEGLVGSQVMQREKFIERVLLLLALSSITSLALITFFIFLEGLPLILPYRAGQFHRLGPLGPHQGPFRHPGHDRLLHPGHPGGHGPGRAPGSELRHRPGGVLPPRLKLMLKPTLELLAGIPSVVYGFLGVVWLVPLIRNYLGGPGLSLLAAAVILGIMILPTVISISIDALSAVPRPLPGRLHRPGGHPVADGAPGGAAGRLAPASSPRSSWAWAGPSARPWR